MPDSVRRGELMFQSVNDKGFFRAVAPGVACILATPVVIAATALVEQGIHRWVNPNFFHSSGDLILGVCGFLASFACMLTGMVLVLKAPAPWAWRVAIIVLPFIFICWLLTAAWGMFL